MDAELKKKIDSWMELCPFQNLKDEVQTLLDEGNEKELSDRFYKDAEFGTGGIRLVMAGGTNRINEEVVGKVTQGLANYIVAQDSKKYLKRGVAIAFDSRHNHDKYMRETAQVLAGNGIHVHVFDVPRPTPLLSYAVRHLKTIAGIVLTASHNTSEYNGYKVYWEDGGQIVPPHDKSIIGEVRKVASYNDVKRMEYEDALEKGFVSTIPDSIFDTYYDKLKGLIIRNDCIEKHGKDLKIVYTPLHGATGTTMLGMFKALGFSNILPVPEQIEPDGSFSTVKSPNPEEPAALAMALELAKRGNADLVAANDPDGDRMALGVKESNGSWALLNGNQVGSIMAWYVLSQKKERNELPEKGALIKTIVTTDLQTDIADSFNITTFNTLTGFKYIGELIKSFEDAAAKGEASHEYIFGGEESYGYLSSPMVRDKDGVMSIALASEIACYAREQGKTLVDLLHDIYRQYGVYKEALTSLTMKGQEGGSKIAAIMDTLRNNPPQEMDGNSLTELRDYKTHEIKDAGGNVTGKLDLPESNVIALLYDDGIKITARPSGTEPKIKFYYAVRVKGDDVEQTLVRADEKIGRLKELWTKVIGQ